ncbi:hypothetical protein TW81_13785 [Vibrio galatheae]|uniref:DUF3293 domain-containing protein n=1 Tax=Vibrio galatheae TaxID=579748 RepID=A0A0F4NGW2_9VIBR|nr:DUF3293 domain-containing protein [Vibrio galatheae]KJY82174.1 hypothetical protein TW81_13785 [Vibrio galatheae]
MEISDELWRAYSDPYFRFEREVDYQRFAIVTAWNPASVWLSKLDNDKRNQHLAKEISHTCYCHVQVGNKDFSWIESSFAIPISPKQAIFIGRKYGQNTIYYIEGDQLFLLSCLAKQNRLSLGNWRRRCR